MHSAAAPAIDPVGLATPAPANGNPSPAGKPIRKFLGRLLQILLLAAAVVAVVRPWWPESVLVSDNAVVNAEIITVAAPIKGRARLSPLEPGAILRRGDPLGVLENALYGNSELLFQETTLRLRVDDLETQLNLAELQAGQSFDELTRFRALARDKVISALELSRIETRFSSAAAYANGVRAQLSHARVLCAQVSQQLRIVRSSPVLAPADAVLWSVVARDGAELAPQDEVVKLICRDQVFVDAFFPEKQGARLKPGVPVEVTLTGGQGPFTGVIRSVRFGVGRVDYESAVPMPPASLAQRLVAVRVAVQWDGALAAGEFFGVGRSAKVVVQPEREVSRE